MLIVRRHKPIGNIKPDPSTDESNVVGIFRPPAFTGCRFDEIDITTAKLTHSHRVLHDVDHTGNVLTIMLLSPAIGRVGVGRAAEFCQASRPVLRQGVIFCRVEGLAFCVMVVSKQIQNEWPEFGIYPPPEIIWGTPLIADLF